MRAKRALFTRSGPTCTSLALRTRVARFSHEFRTLSARVSHVFARVSLALGARSGSRAHGVGAGLRSRHATEEPRDDQGMQSPEHRPRLQRLRGGGTSRGWHGAAARDFLPRTSAGFIAMCLAARGTRRWGRARGVQAVSSGAASPSARQALAAMLAARLRDARSVLSRKWCCVFSDILRENVMCCVRIPTISISRPD